MKTHSKKQKTPKPSKGKLTIPTHGIFFSKFNINDVVTLFDKKGVILAVRFSKGKVHYDVMVDKTPLYNVDSLIIK